MESTGVFYYMFNNMCLLNSNNVKVITYALIEVRLPAQSVELQDLRL